MTELHACGYNSRTIDTGNVCNLLTDTVFDPMTDTYYMYLSHFLVWSHIFTVQSAPQEANTFEWKGLHCREWMARWWACVWIRRQSCHVAVEWIRGSWIILYQEPMKQVHTNNVFHGLLIVSYTITHWLPNASDSMNEWIFWRWINYTNDNRNILTLYTTLY